MAHCPGRVDLHRQSCRPKGSLMRPLTPARYRVQIGRAQSGCWRRSVWPAIQQREGPTMNDRPTVTLIISTNGALIGCAPFGAAVTNRNKALSEEVRELLGKYGYSECE